MDTSGSTHEHTQGVIDSTGTFHTRASVVRSIDNGNLWQTSGGGRTARIRKIAQCPRPGCSVTPYITTAPDHTTANNLDNLPRG